MPLDSVSLQPLSQGVGQVNSIAPEPKGRLKLQKGEIGSLPPRQHGFASIDNSKISQGLRFKSAEGNAKEDAGQIAREKTTHIHKVAFATGRMDELPSLGKFWEGFTTKVKDSAIGRFVQRNILHHVANTQVDHLNIAATASANKKTTLVFELKAQEPSGENVRRKVEAEPQVHKIEVTYDRLRNKRSWYNPMRYLGNDHRTGKVEDILAKLQVDVARQVRLRNLGIGLEQEKTFASNNPGLLAALPEATPKKGVPPPNASDYAKSELQNLKTAAKELGKEADWGPLLDKAIGSEAPMTLTKDELTDLRKIALSVEVEKLQAIKNVCGDYAFTDKQIQDLDELAVVLKGDNPANLEKTIPTVATSLREMSIMAWSAMAPASEKGGDTYKLNLELLLHGKRYDILPLSILMSPCFMSPQALRTQAEKMENYANGKLQNDVVLTDKFAALEEKFQAAGYGSKESEKKIGVMQTLTTERKDKFLENAKHLREIAESSAGMYRFQGMLPILAGANGEQLQSFIQQKLGSVFQQTSGLQPANPLGQAAAVVGGGGLAGLAAVRGNLAAAAVAGTTTWAAAEYLDHDGDKYSSRLQALSDAILHGIASGSEEQLIQANRLIAEEKCDKTVQEWATGNHTEIAKHSEAVGKSEDIQDCNKRLSDLAANTSGSRTTDAAEICTSLDKKIHELGSLEEGIKKTNDSIDNGPLATVEIHSKLRVDDVKAQKEVTEKLVSAGKSVDAECKALKGSFEIVQSAYQNEGKEGGRYFKQITAVEDSIATSIKDWKKGDDHGIEQGLAAIRSKLSTDAPNLTNDHATHLYDLADHLQSAADKAQALKATMLEVGKGLASPSQSYMTGSLDKNVFEVDARFVAVGQFDQDLAKLETAKNAVGEGGKNPYALFRDKESRVAISNPLGDLLQDATKSQESWKKCLTQSSAMVAAAQGQGGIHELKSALQTSAKQLESDSADLQQISEKYKDLKPDGQFDFASNIKNLHEASLRTGVARLVGLSEVPPPKSCHAALDLLSGPLADPDLHKSVAKYLEQSENQSNKADALQSLFSELPEAGKSSTDWTAEDTENWKAKLTDKSEGLKFLGKLFSYVKGDNELNSAINTAKMISSGDTQKSIIADLYSAPIESFLAQAAKNEDLRTVFATAFKSGDLNSLFQKLASHVDKLVSYGLDEDLKSKASSVEDLFKKFQDSTSRANLAGSDFETLLKFSKVLANLQATPEATRQHQVRLAALDLLANVDESFKNLQDPKEAEAAKLQRAFTPQPKNLEDWEKFKAVYKTTYKEYEKLDKFVQATQRTKAGQEETFKLNGGNQDLVAPRDRDVQIRRDNLLNAHQLYSSGGIMAALNSSSALTKNEAVLEKSRVGKQLKNSGIDFESLKWTNVKTCQQDEKLESLDQKILDQRIATNLHSNFRAGQVGIYYVFKENKSPDVVDWLGKYGMRPSDEKSLDTLTRIFAKSGDQMLSNRLDALRGFMESESQLKEYSPKLETAKLNVKNSEQQRDKLLADHQSIVFKNAVRATILTYCVEKGIQPNSLSNDPHEVQIKETLATYGWSDNAYPAGLSIQTYFTEAKDDRFLETWKSEAGNMRSDLARIEGQIDTALQQLKVSLDLLNKEIADAVNENVIRMRDEGKALSREGSALLASAEAHATNLVGEEQEYIHAKSLASAPLKNLSERLLVAHPAKSDVLRNWDIGTSNKLNMNEIRASGAWEQISKSVFSELENLHDVLLDCKPDSRPPYFNSLVASRALEFDRAAIQEIRKVHDQTAGKVEAEVSKIENLRTQFYLLSVENSLPKNLIANENTNRTWVENFFAFKEKSALKLDERFAKIRSNNDMAAHFKKMHPLEFLELFKEGKALHTFFSERAAESHKEEFSNLVSHMGKLRKGFEGMEEKLSSYKEGAFTNFLDSSKFSPPPKSSSISKTLRGDKALNSIGKILKDHEFPIDLKEFNELVTKSDIKIKSEDQYNQTVAELEVDLTKRQEVQDDEDLESLDENISEYGDDEISQSVDQEYEVAGRNSGQARLQEYMWQASFTSRRSLDIDQLDPNQSREQEGKLNELEK